MAIKIVGTGSALPERIVTNKELADIVETSDEWIRERTGIVTRHISTGETVAGLSAQACEKALEMAGKGPEEIDLILVATCSAEMALPCVACEVQSILGADGATAFDLNAACSGFLFALSTAYAYLSSGVYQNALIVGAEVLSKIVDWTDRSTCVLFGDGAGAAVIENSQEKGGILSIAQGADGTKGSALSCENRGLQNFLIDGQKQLTAEKRSGYVQMNGQEVYKFATRKVPECIEEALEKAGCSVDEIDCFVLHQANLRIIQTVARRLGADIGKFPTNLEHVGNMSSAAIPVLLDELNRQGRLKPGMTILLSGFGAGLTYGACVVKW